MKIIKKGPDLGHPTSSRRGYYLSTRSDFLIAIKQSKYSDGVEVVAVVVVKLKVTPHTGKSIFLPSLHHHNITLTKLN